MYAPGPGLAAAAAVALVAQSLRAVRKAIGDYFYLLAVVTGARGCGDAFWRMVAGFGRWLIPNSIGMPEPGSGATD